ncbi:MAG: hypothetical protein V1770_04535 [bacterium]
MKKYIKIALFIILAAIIIGFSFYYLLPIKRIGISSELIMLGDFNNDNKWDDKDKQILDKFILEPFSYSSDIALKVDMNKNGLIDDEDIEILLCLYEHSDPYIAEQKSGEKGKIFPRPRELFRYIPKTEYIQRPLYTLKQIPLITTTPFEFVKKINVEIASTSYESLLLKEIYNEAIRFAATYNNRRNSLHEIEKKYAQEKITYCESLYDQKYYYNLLLNLIGMVEDAETLTVKGQSKFVAQTLYFRDHLRDLLDSDDYKKFTEDEIPYHDIFKKIENLAESDLSIKIDLEKSDAPRDFSDLQNYIDRTEWQYYKSSNTKDDFRKLLLYAQYDRRYLRSASKTSPKSSDLALRNHNLPMILLFREALRIKSGDKKAAVGMLDEAIRIPFGWIKSIPKEQLPSSIALENFLLPGNKEDGSDKSRHWNVFGGIAIYKSPEESFLLALQREAVDLKNSNYSASAMTEFIRDTIANLNGIYYVSSIDPMEESS